MSNINKSQQEEINKIQQKYIPQKQEDKMELLRRLDKSVKQPGRTTSLTVGIISSLFLGVAMALIMELQSLMILGVLLGMIGLIGMIAAYPIYKSMTNEQHKKLAPQIIKLSND